MDVVITYVDITERFKEQYSKYVKKELEENRFRSYGVLDLQIKGIRKYMPYIKNIFVVVSEKEQVEGIDLSDAIIIEHKDIIPERYLPCFNSCVIEMFLWKIPGLDEEFIYFNDDMFVIDKVHPSKWFIKGKPVLFPKEHAITDDITNTFYNRCINSTRLAASILNKECKDTYLLHQHCPKPYLKSSCEKVFNLKVFDIIHSLTRTRHSKNYNCYLFNDYDFLSNNCYVIENKYIYVKIYDSLDIILDYIYNKTYPNICINDNNENIDFNIFKIELRNILEANIFNKKYEKPKNTNIIINNFDLKILNKPDIYQNYNKVKLYKKVIYTCITGNYDNLIDPIYITPDFDYICFSDDINLKSNVWKILPIPKELSKLSKVKQQRNIKINTHKYLPQYDLSIWVDTSVSLSSNINNILYKLDFSNYNIFITIHPDRDCIYQEGKKCIELKKDTEKNINKELNIFKKNGMPEHYGLLETNVIIKLHNMPSCKHLMEMWCDYLNSYSHRDQISLPYCLWKLNYTKLYKLPKKFNHTKYFNYDPGTHYITNICIVHYNTPELTNALIKNINKIVKRPKIWIFDNSDKYPFIYKYDNLIYIDNTKGQYINFDKWLENYPTRLLSKEGTQSYGSAKHSISIQKCIELINDNFILMDSDILIKSDISFMFNKKYLYVGTSEKQPKVKDIYRVLPFICFINVDIMKKYNLTYFNENYMHGLHLTKEGDWYDTGGNFYRISRKFPYLEINIWDYIIHYKGGSWEEIHNNRIGRELTSKEWLEINKKYWE